MKWNEKEKLKKRGLKYFSWFLVALFTGIGFVGYFTPIRPLIVNLFTFKASFSNYFWVAFYGGFCWLQAGLVREQFCKYICPYARFQGAMFDRDTLIIAYDKKRGEPRRRLKKADREHPETLGFCVNCTMCVQVCPTGIEIRDGLQLECIACAACIDACDNMMDQINAPRGLIRYTSSNALEGKKTRILRPKTLGYAVVIMAAFSAFVSIILMKTDVELDVYSDRTTLSREIRGKKIQNVYTVQILNKTENKRRFILGMENLPDGEIENNKVIEIEGNKVRKVIISVDVPIQSLDGKTSTSFYFTVVPEDDPNDIRKQKAIFTGKIH